MPENLLLSTLGSCQSSVLKDLDLVHLTQGETLIEPEIPIRQVYFPTTCLASFVSEMESGVAVETGTVGFDGMIGLPIFHEVETTGMKSFIQIPGDSFCMDAKLFARHLQEEPELRRTVGHFAESFLTVVSQAALCQAFHTIEQRLSRWLLMVQDQTGREDLPLTQEFLAIMLGVQRPTVTLSARLLQSAGLIAYRRGHIRISNRAGLEEVSCDCYRSLRGRFPFPPEGTNGASIASGDISSPSARVWVQDPSIDPSRN